MGLFSCASAGDRNSGVGELEGVEMTLYGLALRESRKDNRGQTTFASDAAECQGKKCGLSPIAQEWNFLPGLVPATGHLATQRLADEAETYAGDAGAR